MLLSPRLRGATVCRHPLDSKMLGISSSRGRDIRPRRAARCSVAFLRCALIATVLAAAACGDDDGPDDGSVRLDGSTDADVDGGVPAPDIPWLAASVPPVALSPCRAGWREVTVGDVTECDPYPAGGPAECASGEAHFPGEPGCRPIGDACPSGDYATTVPSDGTTVYVNASAAAGGDGSIASPYAGLSEVPWVSLATGTTVALARGTYPGAVALKAGIQLVGTCVAETTLSGATGPVAAAVTVTSTGEPATVRNVRITDATHRGALVDRGRSLSLEGVLVERTWGQAILAATPGTSLTLRDTVVRDTQSDGSTSGRAVDVELGAHLDAQRLIIARNPRFAVYAGGAGTEVRLADVAIVDTLPSTADDTLGWGLSALEGAHVDARGVFLARNRDVAVVAEGPGSEMILEDVVVQDTEPRASDGTFGGAILVHRGARLEATRLVAARNYAGVLASDDGTSVSLADAVIRDLLSTTGQTSGRAIEVAEGANLDASRVIVARSRNVAVLIDKAGSTATLTDVAVHDTQPSSDARFGRGIEAEHGGQITASRVLVSGSHDVGLLGLGLGTRITVSNVVVRDTEARESDLLFGYGVELASGAQLLGDHLSIDTTRLTGLYVLADASAEISQFKLSNVQRSGCGDCPDDPHGHGVIAVNGTVRLTDFEVKDVDTCGLFIVSEPGLPGITSVDVSSGVVERSTIGACVQVDGYDIARLSDDVMYRDNEQNLDSTMLPVPAPAEAL